MGVKVCLRCKCKTLLDAVNKLLKTKSLLTSASNVLPCILPEVNFPTHSLNFHWRWRWLDGIQAIFLNRFYFKIKIANSWKFWPHCAKGAFVTQCPPRVQLHFVTREQNGCWFLIISSGSWKNFKTKEKIPYSKLSIIRPGRSRLFSKYSDQVV